MAKGRQGRPSSAWVRWVLLPFLLLAVAGLVVALRPVALHLLSWHWVSVPATLGGIEEITAPRAVGSSMAHSTRLAGTYHYDYNGQRYQSERLSFSLILAYGLDDWDERLTESLGEPGNAIHVWVNPAAPAESVAVRDIRWGEVGAGLLFAFGMGAGPLALWPALSRRRSVLDPAATAAAPKPVTGLALAIIWTVALVFTPLCPLLWRDSHGVWAVVALIPLALALNALRVKIAQGLKSGEEAP